MCSGCAWTFALGELIYYSEGCGHWSHTVPITKNSSCSGRSGRSVSKGSSYGEVMVARGLLAADTDTKSNRQAAVS